MTLTPETLAQLASYAEGDADAYFPKSISNATMLELIAGYGRGDAHSFPDANVADADGWIAHNGGPCPVPGVTPVKAWFKDGFRSFPSRASFWSVGCWTHTDRIRANHIIAYRPEGQGGKP